MSEQKETEITEMAIKEIGGKRYYTRRDEAEAARRKGDRIYFKGRNWVLYPKATNTTGFLG